jgi:hypothetical protein
MLNRALDGVKTARSTPLMHEVFASLAMPRVRKPD